MRATGRASRPEGTVLNRWGEVGMGVVVGEVLKCSVIRHTLCSRRSEERWQDCDSVIIVVCDVILTLVLDVSLSAWYNTTPTL